MARIPDLPLAAALTGDETVVLVQDDTTKRSPIGALVDAALGTIPEDVAADAALAGQYANDDTDADVPGGAAGERGAKYWAAVAAAAGISTGALIAGLLLSEEDSEGRVSRLMQANGAQYIHQLERPGPSGFADRINVWAELNELASAQRLTANTVALRSAVRTNGQFPQPVQRLAANDIPVLTYSAGGAASTIAGSALIPMTDARFRYPVGLPTFQSLSYPYNEFYRARGGYYGASNGSGGMLYETNAFAVEFVHTGTQFELKIMGGNAGANPSFTVLVNGKRAGDVVSVADANPRLIKGVFATSATRAIRVLIHGGYFGGVRVAAPDAITSTGRSYPVATIMSDSFGEGAGVSRPCGSLAAVLAMSLGVCGAVAGVGSTGIINPGGNNTAGYPKVAYADATRLLDLTLSGTGFAPAMGVVMGTGNDAVASGVWGPYGATLEDAIANRMHVIFDAWSAAPESTGKPLFVIGNWNVHGQAASQPTIDNYRIRDGMQKAAAARSAENMHFIDQLKPDFMVGLSTTAGSQSDYYSHTDDVHPSQPGHDYRGLGYAEEVRQRIFNLA